MWKSRFLQIKKWNKNACTFKGNCFLPRKSNDFVFRCISIQFLDIFIVMSVRSLQPFKGASVVWHHSLPLMNSFNKTEAAVFSCRLCFLRAFPFISLIKHRVSYFVGLLSAAFHSRQPLTNAIVSLFISYCHQLE